MRNPARYRAATAIRGVTALLFAVPLLFWNGVDTNGLVMAFAGYALISAAAALVAAYDGRSPSLALRGGTDLIAGTLFLMWPGIDLLRTVYILGAWAMLTGILEMFAAARITGAPVARWARAGAGVAMIGLGSLLAFFPELEVTILGVLLGGAVFLFGLLLLAPAGAPGLTGDRHTRIAVSGVSAR